MKFFILFALLSFNSLACEDGIFKQVLKNKSTANTDWAKKFAKVLCEEGEKNKLSPRIAAAIAMQESSYRDIISYRKGKVLDVGIFQFNVRTIKNNNIDQEKVLNDIRYATKHYYKIMKEKRSICKKYGKEFWGCYHSSTPHLHKKYIQMVSRWL